MTAPANTAAASQTQKSGGGRPALVSRDDIIGAGLELIREQGTGFSMRALSRKLGVAVTSIYHNFKDKGELLDAVAQQALSDLQLDVQGRGSWHSRLSRWMDHFRDKLAAEPELLLLIESTAVAPAWIETLATPAQLLAEAGFSSRQQANQIQSIAWEVMGFAFLEEGCRERGLGDNAVPEEVAGRGLPVERRLYEVDYERVWAATRDRTIAGIVSLAETRDRRKSIRR